MSCFLVCLARVMSLHVPTRHCYGGSVCPLVPSLCALLAHTDANVAKQTSRSVGIHNGCCAGTAEGKGASSAACLWLSKMGHPFRDSVVRVTRTYLHEGLADVSANGQQLNGKTKRETTNHHPQSLTPQNTIAQLLLLVGEDGGAKHNNRCPCSVPRLNTP